MQDRPDKATLLDAVAVFLNEELRPHVEDKALAFPVLIAANLARIVADEVRMEQDNNTAELGRLQALLPDINTDGEHPAQIQQLNDALSERIREKAFGPDQVPIVWSHVMQTLREKLAVVNPRFDARPPVV